MDYYLLNLLADFKMSFLQNENKTSEFLMWTWRATPKIYLTCINWLDTLNPKLSNIFTLAFKIYEIFDNFYIFLYIFSIRSMYTILCSLYSEKIRWPRNIWTIINLYDMVSISCFVDVQLYVLWQSF